MTVMVFLLMNIMGGFYAEISELELCAKSMSMSMMSKGKWMLSKRLRATMSNLDCSRNVLHSLLRIKDL
mgnify:CR=1 FL=1